MSRSSYAFWLDHSNNTWWSVQIMDYSILIVKFIIIQFHLHLSCFLPQVQTLRSSPRSETPSGWFVTFRCVPSRVYPTRGFPWWWITRGCGPNSLGNILTYCFLFAILCHLSSLWSAPPLPHPTSPHRNRTMAFLASTENLHCCVCVYPATNASVTYTCHAMTPKFWQTLPFVTT